MQDTLMVLPSTQTYAWGKQQSRQMEVGGWGRELQEVMGAEGIRWVGIGGGRDGRSL